MLEVHFDEITDRLLSSTEDWRATQQSKQGPSDVAPSDEVDAMDINVDDPMPGAP